MKITIRFALFSSSASCLRFDLLSAARRVAHLLCFLGEPAATP